MQALATRIDDVWADWDYQAYDYELEELDDKDTVEENEIIDDSVSRRAFLSRLTAAGLGVSALSISASADAANFIKRSTSRPIQFQRENSFTPLPKVMNEKHFRLGVIGPIELSLAASKIAVSKAADRDTREFAGFELSEAIGVTSVLKELRTAVPAMDAKARAAITTLKNTPQGELFDKAYIQAQLDNHIVMRDLAQNYLKNSAGKTSMAEIHTRHIATLMLSSCTEHIALTTRILDGLTA